MLTLGVFGRLGGHFGAISEASWGSLGGVRERLGRVSGDLGGVWGASCARLGAAWGGLGTFWGVLGRLRSVLEALWCAPKKRKKPVVL